MLRYSTNPAHSGEGIRAKLADALFGVNVAGHARSCLISRTLSGRTRGRVRECGRWRLPDVGLDGGLKMMGGGCVSLMRNVA